MRIKYCLIYLADVVLGRHGFLTPRQVYGDFMTIWSTTEKTDLQRRIY